MRDLRGVMDHVLDLIPEGCPDKELLSVTFDEIITSSHYTPPELMTRHWIDFSQTLDVHLPLTPENLLKWPWLYDILELVNDKPVERLNVN